MMDILDLNVGFWTGLLIIAAIILAIWGIAYAAVLAEMIAWVAIVALAAFLVWALGARFKRVVVHGRRRKR